MWLSSRGMKGRTTQPPTVMTSDRYLRRYAEDPSGLGTDAQWTFSLVPEQLHRAPFSTTLCKPVTIIFLIDVSSLAIISLYYSFYSSLIS
jgi:hypothetical protein